MEVDHQIYALARLPDEHELPIDWGTPEQVWTIYRKEIYFSPAGIQAKMPLFSSL